MNIINVYSLEKKIERRANHEAFIAGLAFVGMFLLAITS